MKGPAIRYTEREKSCAYWLPANNHFYPVPTFATPNSSIQEETVPGSLCHAYIWKQPVL